MDEDVVLLFIHVRTHYARMNLLTNELVSHLSYVRQPIVTVANNFAGYALP